MNLNLSAAASKQRKKSGGSGGTSSKNINEVNKNLGYGLNSRSSSNRGGVTSNARRSAKKSVLAGSDSSSDEDDDGNRRSASGRHDVNKDIVSEQNALRRRAEAAMASTASSTAETSIYDYDAQYEEFASGHDADKKKKEEEEEAQRKKPQKSRYIANMLKHSKHRMKEQEIVYERKIAREQQAEDEKEEYQGKEKFITSAYKRKLAEREAWAKEDEERTKREQEEDVTKKKDGSAFVAGFYGNLSRNVAMGGANKDPSTEEEKGYQGGYTGDHMQEDHHKDFSSWDDSANKRMKVGDDSVQHGRGEPMPTKPSDDTGLSEEKSHKKTLTKEDMREMRAKKVAEARLRYLKRHNMISTIPNQ